MTTAKLYVHSEYPYGIYNQKSIDVTDYETFGPDSRAHKSPLYFLAMMDSHKLGIKQILHTHSFVVRFNCCITIHSFCILLFFCR